MPKGVQNTNPEIYERLKAKVAQTLIFSLNTNKNYDLLSSIIFERTGALLSNSTLRRVFQYDSRNNPTKSTLDLICKSIGLTNWEEFVEKEESQDHSALTQLISTFRLQGLHDHEQIKQIITKYSDNPHVFDLLETIVQIAIERRDIIFLKGIFDFPDIFVNNKYTLNIFYFTHNLVIGLNQSGLMPELVECYGKNPKSQEFIVEWYVDEDNLKGYYYDLLQVYHQHKRTPEALLFYNCLMYQHAIENKLPTNPWADFIREFDETLPVHHIPNGRRLAILLLEATEAPSSRTDIVNKIFNFYRTLSEDQKINVALIMVKLLFINREHKLIETILSLAPDIPTTDKNINDLVNINQLKIYRAYSLFNTGQKESAAEKIKEFNPLFVDTFTHYHIMNDFEVISGLIINPESD
ncbi:MAG: hypothetical protein Q7U54_20410 [Bacteroidales bacterium]|nr:hypothetical protein [Bacteroidales bacterium]